MFSLNYPEGNSFDFRQYFLILNTSEIINTDVGWVLDFSKHVYDDYSPKDYTDEPMRVLNTPIAKLRFAVANYAACRYLTKARYEECLEDVTEFLKELDPEFKGYSFPEITYLGLHDTEFECDLSEEGAEPLYDLGYSIDNDVFFDWLDKHGITNIGEFITSSKYVVIVEKNNNNFFKKLLTSGIIRKDAIGNYDEITKVAEKEGFDD